MKSGWAIKKLGEVCEEVKDRTSSIGVVLSAYITTDNMLKDCAGVCEAENLPPKVTSLVKFRKGDVLLSNIRPYLKKVWLADRDGGASSDVIVFRACSKEIHPRYIWQALARDEFFNYSMLNVSGTKMPRGKREWIKQFEIPIPPLPEQKRIVAKIDAAFEKIDKLKANAERNLANAKELFQSALAEAMRPKDGWVEKRLGEVCKTTSGGTPIKSHREYYEDGNIPWLRSGEVCCKDIIKSEMFITELGLRNSSAKIMPKNTVLIAMYGATAAQAGILRFESATNQAICGILPDKYFEPEFLYYYFRTIQRQLAARAQGGAQPNISQEKIKDTLVPILPLSEQREIVKHLDLLAEKIKILEQNYTKQIADCVEMRQAVLREAFEGRL